MNRHDEERRNRSIRALQGAEVCLRLEHFHLNVKQPPPMQEIYRVQDALAHVVSALNRLTAAEEQTP